MKLIQLLRLDTANGRFRAFVTSLFVAGAVYAYWQENQLEKNHVFVLGTVVDKWWMISGNQVKVEYKVNGKNRSTSEGSGEHKVEIGQKFFVKLNLEQNYARIMFDIEVCENANEQPNGGWDEMPCMD